MILKMLTGIWIGLGMPILLEDSHGLVRTGRLNDTIAAVAKELHDGHADQHIAVEDEYGPIVGRLAVAVGTVHARILPFATTDCGIAGR